ncbi:MAG TPA: rhamnogalacturonan acetylesterase [Flavisolibacter sp.]|jgi:lysophospholipase L1-like esterase|nr:rhamnogalacturonan acetylesterase [Flavisolibacter sp.]
MKYTITLFCALTLASFAPLPKKVRIWMAGDSTMSVKDTRAYPETGWGMPFVYFFDSTIQVENLAKNGRSTRTFISEGLWQQIASQASEGDYVLIQFGHNDESKEKTDRYTTPEEYKANLTRFVQEARARKATPILLTPVSRRKFVDGKAVATHEHYAPLVKEVAAALQVPLIDLDTQSRELYQQLGEEASKLLFLQVKPGEHPNYPEGKTDNTHFSELGARLIAEIVLHNLQAMPISLKEHLIKPVKK